ncbi:pentapeptide repeat-containing protein [Streptomyces sp. NBC_01571]|uniref:pentapeptide repeat-containing protein n=1 Tax=Streptomyces sp. NBC_01571 TaxID=2975883 RepID=UPI002254970A|nr:pentapeptide repeat-containing protein [Streptomyces sp. NBC_01571]MCX4578077.1 pentapeptide repeat-containing protein [Streptomyces sp. NBC_01571]
MAGTDSPAWPQCVHLDAGERCRGRRVGSYTACLAHLDSGERAAHLATLTPGADLDHRGTPFTQSLLDELLAPLRDSGSGPARVGEASFDEVRFSGDAELGEVEFGGHCSFSSAVFGAGMYVREVRVGGDLRLGAAQVAGDVWLDDTVVDGDAWFYGARIAGALHFGVRVVGRSAVFKGMTCANAYFTGARVEGAASFEGAVIDGEAAFDGVVFEDGAEFTGVRIGGRACFDGAHFHRSRACFDGADVGGDMPFAGAHFAAEVTFEGAAIGGDLAFHGARVNAGAVFRRTGFRRTARIGPLVCTGTVDFSDAVFETAVTVEAAAAEVCFRRTRWASTAVLRLRYAGVDLSDAVLEFPVTVVRRLRPFVSQEGGLIAEPGLTDARVRVTSVKGVDAAHLVLADVDLTGCLFVETVHLDQLRLEGRCVLSRPPDGLRWIRRRTLAEEHHWRATRYSGLWTPAPPGVETHEPAVLAPVYRQLRKALEDSRNEPGAADFYYGEMEMRRHDAVASRSERRLLRLYWALSGYGLRASRALAWLVLAMTATVLAMMLWGLPQSDPDPVSVGTKDGHRVTLTTKKPTPVNPRGPYTRRLSTARFEKSLRVVINSVIFRASGQDLTTTGTYVEMTARLVEPALLGLAVLAVRSRVKR